MANLNERQLNLVQQLLSVRQTTASQLATQLMVSTKTIYHDLQVIEPVLAEHFITIKRQPRIGITLVGDLEEPQRLLRELQQQTAIPDNDHDRVTYILTQLLKTSDFITVGDLATQLFIGAKTIERNLQQLERQLAAQQMTLDHHPKRGIRLLASEQQKRQLLFRLLSTFWGEHWRVESGQKQNVVSYQELANNTLLPAALVKQLIAIVNQFVAQRELTISDYAFQSLVIHLAIAIQRVRDGNPIKVTHPAKPQIGQQQLTNATRLAKRLDQTFNVQLPVEEVSYIQIHLIAATAGGVHLEIDPQATPAFSELPTLLKDFGYDQELLVGLTVHLESAIKRLKVNATISNPFMASIKQNYTQAFDEGLNLARYYEQHEQIQMNDDEVAYLALHLEAFLERQRLVSDRLNVVIVCSTGLGSAQLLAAKVRKQFPQLKIVGVWSIQDLQQHKLTQVDLIISTIQLQVATIPTVIVSPLLESNEVQFVQQAIRQSTHQTHPVKRKILSMLSPNLVFAKRTLTSWQAVINLLGQQLVDQRLAKPGIVASALKRESLSYTSFGNYAVPHAEPDLIAQPRIVVCTLAKPIQWGEQQVSIIFFLAMTKHLTQAEIDEIFDDFYELVSNPHRLEILINSESDQDLYNQLIGVIEK
ncbi:BglG family transcription antiterminator [Lactiplantibacillus mudanjiangensis]|uniref:PTS system, fructose-specific IIA component (Plasmid) [Lactobacillus rhamnosus Lc 705] n=1 Tax=Lactiplantibacillus mudanjiangensis TaxID=1296538 RepID=A0A660E5Y9_9LACO|nr:BglG family transcription antiterminator [Lactiplantibacillus mudanjiangensis]VDG20260.1 PTS system, fructose-specific IIA component (plasmid) [Lactobacillus rhamnosus Lc 705] [Lactiplantibacillus mudanjiangensis]VDG24049.1 PTS system, fructose-specific IIA component (plasmid) [Lactobacillus rhamnosus Lc 705] [Lactiplantibacillus mudanjiangensis]VDG30229.1 PTS system, fructose-specific IIA component (plasmid) [Lactobacillus rhamnosus Lc 705] [Lactiplantibacillus mudanjiangensis]VDG33853.1 PT